MEVKHLVRVILLFVAFSLFCYQVQIAVKSIVDPPMMITTSERHISEITPPLMYLCPLGQFDKKKLELFNYDNEADVLEGKIINQRQEYYRSWGSHENITFEQLIKNVIKDVPEDKIYGKLLSPKLFPKFGYCFEVDYNVQDTFQFPEKIPFLKNYTILLTDKSTRSYFSVNMASQLGDKIRIFLTQPSVYSFFVEVEVYEAAPEKSKCKGDPNYSYEQCVDELVHADLKPKINCVLPFLSERDHCQNFSKKYKAKENYCIDNYVLPYIMLGETKAQKLCQKPCKQQRIRVSLRDESPINDGYGSTILINFNPNVKVLKEEQSYIWFNFIVDVGSSFGTWVGISAISLIHFALEPVATIKELFSC